MVIMTHQTVSLEKYWKLLPATLSGPGTNFMTMAKLYNKSKSSDNFLVELTVRAVLHVVAQKVTTEGEVLITCKGF